MNYKFRKRTILSTNTNELIECKYLFMYRRKFNQKETNPLYDKNSSEVNLLQFGNEEIIKKYSIIFNNLLQTDCIIIPMISEFSSIETFKNISNFVNEICLRNQKRINGSKLIIRTQYHGNIREFFKETVSKDFLINKKEMQILKEKNVVVLTDIINNNLSGYITYRNIIRKYQPKTVELVGLARYVET